MTDGPALRPPARRAEDGNGDVAAPGAAVLGPQLPPEMAATRAVFRSADGAWFTVSLLEGRVGLRLAGDADVLSVRVLREAIAALPAGLGEVHLQLSGLDAIDLSAVRELIAIARQPSRPRVILHHPPPALLRIIRLVGAGSASQFRVAERVPDYLVRADVS